MKKIALLLVAAMCCFVGAQAQNNLQFNRVFLETVSYTPSSSLNYSYADVTFTVPAGKIWKVETAHGTYKSTSTTNPSYNAYIHVLINDNLVSYYNSNGVTVTGNHLPMWLPAGTYTLRASASASAGSVGVAIGTITGIEFNITP